MKQYRFETQNLVLCSLHYSLSCNFFYVDLQVLIVFNCILNNVYGHFHSANQVRFKDFWKYLWMIIFLSIYFLDFFQDEEKKIPNLYVSFFHYFAILKFNLNFSKFYAQNASLEKPNRISNCICIFTFLKVPPPKN